MIRVRDYDYNADEGKFIIRIKDDFIMGRSICLGSNDSIDNYYEREYTEEEYNQFYESIMRSEVININRNIIYNPVGINYKGNVDTIQDLNSIIEPQVGDIYKVLYESDENGIVKDDKENPVLLNSLYIYEKIGDTYQWTCISNNNRELFNKEL